MGVPGSPADPTDLVDVSRLVDAYYSEHPDPAEPPQQVAFGTSGHRGSSLERTFNEWHILAITQATCERRARTGIDGPLFLGIDTHALSEPASRTALEVLVANGVEVCVDRDRSFTPTPAVSHAILTHNEGRREHLADGIVATPSHNPPEDGGIKYNPPEGGPAPTEVTNWIQDRANEILAGGLRDVRRLPYEQARAAPNVHEYDYRGSYIRDLAAVVDAEAIRCARLKIGVDPLGGASVGYWPEIAERYRLDLTVVNERVDPTFGFMTLDWDGKIRMDCSSPYAMASLIGMASRFDIAFGNDPDADRHGIVTRGGGLLNPNHYLAVAVSYLFQQREAWAGTIAVGKTVVTSAIVDRVAADLGRRLFEVPVGFKWFVDGLLEGWLGFGGEESAGASFLRQDGAAWTTDKDGLILCLLAAELTARTGRAPDEHYATITARLGTPAYTRIDSPATAEQKARLAQLSPDEVPATRLAGEPILKMLTRAPGNDSHIGGLKVITQNGWFAARPSGTEDVYKIYAESFVDEDHLQRIVDEARAIVDGVLQPAGD